MNALSANYDTVSRAIAGASLRFPRVASTSPYIVTLASGRELAFDPPTVWHEARHRGCADGAALMALAIAELVRELDNAL